MAPSRVASALAIALGLTLAGPALAGPEDGKVAVDGRSSFYADTDATWVSTTVVGAVVKPIEEVSVNGRYLADIVSSASVDVVSAATGRWQETRHEGAGGLGYYDGTNKVSAGYVYSVEHDWLSHTGSLSASRDFLQHRLTLGLGGSFTTNDIGRAADANFKRTGKQGSGGVDVTVVLSKRDIVGLNYTLVYVNGYNASPYRFVYFDDDAFAGARASTPEVVPDVRVRHALGARWNRHLFRDTVLRSHLRGYGDDWGILSVTGGTEYVVGVGLFEVGAFVRGYGQSGASFYQDDYDARYRYMTADRELSSFFDVFGGLRAAYHSDTVSIFEDLRAEAKVTGFAFAFSEFEELPSRQGIIADLGLGASF